MLYLLGDVEVLVEVADIDVDEEEVLVEELEVRGLVEVDVEDLAVAAPVAAEVEDDPLVFEAGLLEGGRRFQPWGRPRRSRDAS